MPAVFIREIVADEKMREGWRGSGCGRRLNANLLAAAWRP
jgi:hypothetical protein